jgi:hypothetical protein
MKFNVHVVLALLLGSTADAFAPAHMLVRGTTAAAPAVPRGRALRETVNDRVEKLRREGELRVAAKLVMNAAYQQKKAQLQGLDDADAAAAAAQGDAASRIEQLRLEGEARLASRETMAAAYMVGTRPCIRSVSTQALVRYHDSS